MFRTTSSRLVQLARPTTWQRYAAHAATLPHYQLASIPAELHQWFTTEEDPAATEEAQRRRDTRSEAAALLRGRADARSTEEEVLVANGSDVEQDAPAPDETTRSCSPVPHAHRRTPFTGFTLDGAELQLDYRANATVEDAISALLPYSGPLWPMLS